MRINGRNWGVSRPTAGGGNQTLSGPAKSASIDEMGGSEKRLTRIRFALALYAGVGVAGFTIEPLTGYLLPAWATMLVGLGIIVACGLFYSIYLYVRGHGLFRPWLPVSPRHFNPVMGAILYLQSVFILSSFKDLPLGLLTWPFAIFPCSVAILSGQRAIDSGSPPYIVWLGTFTAYALPLTILSIERPQDAVMKVIILSPLLIGLPVLAIWLAQRRSAVVEQVC
jgi:hypothetical protein